MTSPRLIVTPEAAELGLVATYHVATTLSNSKEGEEFERLKQAALPRFIERYTPEFVANDPVILGFRALRQAVGRSPKKYPCSIESLISFVQRRGQLPSINLAVDIYNLVSLETRLTMGAHDLDQVAGNITLRLAKGDERFLPLGSQDVESVRAGEYCYFDDVEVLCRLDYKQCDKTKLSADTKRCLFILQGNKNTPVEILDQAKARLTDLLGQFCEGS
jgi:DNA/RNA-binding domain of Phe-tRNA-synthetase-like protein